MTLVSERLSAYLGLRKPVTVDQVLSQLRFIQENADKAMTSYKLTQKICNDIYQFMQVGYSVWVKMSLQMLWMLLMLLSVID